MSLVTPNRCRPQLLQCAFPTTFAVFLLGFNHRTGTVILLFAGWWFSREILCRTPGGYSREFSTFALTPVPGSRGMRIDTKIQSRERIRRKKKYICDCFSPGDSDTPGVALTTPEYASSHNQAIPMFYDRFGAEMQSFDGWVATRLPHCRHWVQSLAWSH